MLIVTGTVEVRESGLETLKTAAVKMAVASRAETGCQAYAFYQSIETPTLFRIYEEWDDEAALAAHFAEPHMAKFRQSLAYADIKAMNVVKFVPGDMSPVG